MQFVSTYAAMKSGLKVTKGEANGIDSGDTSQPMPR